MSKAHTILCIDDDARERAVLRAVLSASAYEVWEATGGREGLDLARQQPDLIILDVGMPEMSGFEVCQRLRESEETRRIPVLHLTGQFREDDDRVSGLEGGADAYLVKPTANNVLLATVRSLLRMRDAEQALAAAVRQAEAANEAKTRFLSRITHRLRMPLNAVIGSSGLLLESALTPRQREHATGIKRHSFRLLSLVNDVLDATRLDMHNVALEDTEFDPRGACADVCDMLKDRADAKHLALLFDVAPDVPVSVRADVGRFRQVLVHLVENAVKFTPTGSVTLRLSSEQADGGGMILRVEVTDTGGGVTPEREGSLFVPLAPLDDMDPDTLTGTGLGLAISRAVVELMSGAIGYHKNKQGGSLFWFTIPVQPSVPLSSGMNNSHIEGIAGLRVLVVDDNEVNRKVARGLLKGLGCDVTLAAGGQVAVDVMRQASFDAILMDLTMPGMDGFETTRHIREMQKTAEVSRTPIIAVTAQTDEASRRQCSLADMDDFVPKPIDRDALVSALLAHVHSGGAVDAPDVVQRPQVSPEATQDLPCFDLAVLLDLMGGDRSAARDILDVFIAQVHTDVDLLERGIDQHDVEQVARQAHSLKGSSANVGAQSTRQAATQLEEAAKREDWDAIPVYWEALKDALAAALTAMQVEVDCLGKKLEEPGESDKKVETNQRENAVNSEPTATGPIQVMICDDSVAMRGTLARMLERYPVEVVGKAGSPDEAIRLADKLSPELIFLDVVMPGGSGLDVLRRLRERPDPPVIVMLSSVAEHGTVIECRHLGAADYLLKPFDASTLKSCVERIHTKLRRELP